MNCLSIRQPWAGMITHGLIVKREDRRVRIYKDVENRTWFTRYRGPLLIHASQTVDREAHEKYRKYIDFPLTRGALIGKVTLKDVTKKRSSKWHERGLFGWYLEHPVAFPRAAKWRGQLKLFDVNVRAVIDDDLEFMWDIATLAERKPPGS